MHQSTFMFMIWLKQTEDGYQDKDQVKGETMLTGVSGQVIEMISEHYQLKKQH